MFMINRGQVMTCNVFYYNIRYDTFGSHCTTILFWRSGKSLYLLYFNYPLKLGVIWYLVCIEQQFSFFYISRKSFKLEKVLTWNFISPPCFSICSLNAAGEKKKPVKPVIGTPSPKLNGQYYFTIPPEAGIAVFFYHFNNSYCSFCWFFSCIKS